MRKVLFFLIVWWLSSSALQAQKINFSPPSSHSKLKLGLAQMISPSKDAPRTNSIQQPFQLKDTNKKILVDVIAKNDVEILKKELSTSSIEIIGNSEKRVTCWMELDRIISLAEKSKEIAWIQPVIKPLNNTGPVRSQGDSAQRSGIARQLTGLNGAGVKIGVLSDSYNLLSGAAAGVASGELPGTGNPNGYTTPVTVLSESIYGGSDEGRAMIEIIHDVAPGAQIYFYSAYNGEAAFANGIRALAAAGCKVIVDDITYLMEPFFQDGLIAQAVDEVTANYGVSYYSSAGNSANNSYQAPYKSSAFMPFNGSTETAHNFSTAENPVYLLPINVLVGITMCLQWNDPYYSTGGGSSGATSDLNLYLLGQVSGGYQVIASSTESNIGADPYELLEVYGSGIAYVMITKKAGTNPGIIKFVGFRGLDWSYTPPGIAGIKSSTIIGHHNAAGTISVGAASYDETPAYGVSPPEVESFSSYGGTPIYRSISGSLLPEAIVRQKPDIVAPDNGNTSFFINGYDYENDGRPNFNGTSAAAPHAAGVAALMLQGNATLTPQAIKTALINSSVDMDNPDTPDFDIGFDYATGHGLIKADVALQSTINPNCPAINITVTRPTTFCEGDSVILDANVAEGYSFQWKKNNANLTGKTQAQIIAKESGAYSVAITRLNCTLTSDAIGINARPGVPIPTTVSRSISEGTTIGSGNGLQASAKCHAYKTATYSGPTVGYDNGTQNGLDPTVSISGLSGNIILARVSIRWHKKSGGTINDCGLSGANANPFNDEVSFKLVGPDNTTINIINADTYSMVGTYIGAVTTIFEDGAAVVGANPVSGTFRPAQNLALFNGKSPNGVWKLLAKDNAPTDPLCVESFSVTLFTNAEGSSSTITWWNSTTGGAQVGTGSEYIPTDTAPGNYTYYAEAECPDGGLNCHKSIRQPATLTIIANCVTQAGSINGTASVCALNNGTLTLTGYTGNILRWESSTDNFSTLTTISNTNATQNYSGLGRTTQYRAVVKHNSCNQAYSTTATITVTIINATASNTGPYNAGQTIQLTAGGGSSYKWVGANGFQSSSNLVSINNASTAHSGTYTVTVTQNTCSATATTYVSVGTPNPCHQVVDIDYVQAGVPFDYKFPLTDNMVIAQVPEETSIIVTPICSTVSIKSFRMILQGPEPFQYHEVVESTPFYALFNNTGNHILGRHLPPGSYTLTLTGYDQINAQGNISYPAKVIHFTIVAANVAIGTPTFGVTSLCAGSVYSFNVNFASSGTFASGNRFEVQLSDLYGSFDNPVAVGVSGSSGNISCLIPSNVTAGSAYKLRVVSSNPTFNGGPNGTTLSITPATVTLVNPNDNYYGAYLTKRAGQVLNANNKVLAASNISYEAGNAIVLSPGFQADGNTIFKAEIKGCGN